jgi:hypothetical protein
VVALGGAQAGGDADDDIAGQQLDLPVDIHRSMGGLRVAGAQDDGGLHLVSGLVFQRRLDIDLGEDAKALRLLGLRHGETACS